MESLSRLVATAALAAAVTLPAAAHQSRAGDKDDQMVITGCVTRSGAQNSAGPRSLLVWSRGDVYLDQSSIAMPKPSQAAERPVATAGFEEVVLYWLDDEDDFARYAGNRVEIVGEMSGDLDKGEIEVEDKGPFTELEFDVDGRETTVHVPTSWLMIPEKKKDFDVVVRTIDVEKVTVLGPCSR